MNICDKLRESAFTILYIDSFLRLFGTPLLCIKYQFKTALSLLYRIKKQEQYHLAPTPVLIFLKDLLTYSSSSKISSIWQAAFATGEPGPKIAATPALYKKS